MKLYKSHIEEKKLEEKIERDKREIANLSASDNNPTETIIIYESSPIEQKMKKFMRHLLEIIVFLGIGIGISILLTYLINNA